MLIGAGGQDHIHFHGLYSGHVVEDNQPVYEVMDIAWQIIVIDRILSHSASWGRGIAFGRSRFAGLCSSSSKIGLGGTAVVSCNTSYCRGEILRILIPNFELMGLRTTVSEIWAVTYLHTRLMINVLEFCVSLNTRFHMSATNE